MEQVVEWEGETPEVDREKIRWTDNIVCKLKNVNFVRIELKGTSDSYVCLAESNKNHASKTWFTFGGGQTARGVTRCRRGIGATDPKPRALPACAHAPHPHVLTRARAPAGARRGEAAAARGGGEGARRKWKAEDPAEELQRGYQAIH